MQRGAAASDATPGRMILSRYADQQLRDPDIYDARGRSPLAE
jgi:hypothetical protein